ncbi:sodium:solute symporter family protein [bacterium]|nr:sodium:solute symporter family protein [bacterium]
MPVAPDALTTNFSWWIDGTLIVVFFGSIVFIGSYFHKWIKSPEDYAIAGRQLTPFILAASLAATNINLYNFQSYVGYAYREGISIVWHEWTGLMALAFAGVFILPIFRRLRIATIPEFAGMRYSPALRMLIGVLWTLRFAVWLGIVLYLAAQIGCGVMGLSDQGPAFTYLVFTFGVMTVLFTMAGGMWAVALTDILQFICLLGGALVMIPMIMHTVGYWRGMESTLAELGRSELLNFVPVEGTWNWKGILGIWLLGMQWASTDQAMLQRAFGSKTIKGAAQGMVYAGLIMVAFAFIIPMPGIAYGIKATLGEMPALLKQDNALPYLLASEIVPVGLLGFVLCGLLASQISTLDAGLNSAATVFTQDLYLGFLKRKPSPRSQVLVMRVMTCVVGVFMIGSAYWARASQSGVDLYLGIITVMDLPMFVVIVIYGLLWKRATAAGAIAGYLAGMGFGLLVQVRAYLGAWADKAVDGIYRVYSYLPVLGEGVTADNAGGWDTALIGMIVTAAVVPVVSLLTRQTRAKEVEEIWKHRAVSEEELETGEVFHIWPRTAAGRLWITVMLLGLGAFLVGSFMGKYPSARGYGISKLEMRRFEQTALLLSPAQLPPEVTVEARKALLDDLVAFAKLDATVPDSERRPAADALAGRMKEMMKKYLAHVESSLQTDIRAAEWMGEFSARLEGAVAGPDMPLADNRYAGYVTVLGMLLFFAGAILRMRYD